MNQYKTKLSAWICAALLAVGALAGCSGNSSNQSTAPSASVQESENVIESQSESNPEESTELAGPKTQVRVGTLKGPAGMGMVGLMDSNEQGYTANTYEFSVAGAPEDMMAKIISGDVDIAAVPTNMASVLYNKTQGEVSALAVSTLGVLYIMDSEGSIKTMADLKGKTLYATGQGATPEYVINYLLQKNNLTADVTVEYKAEHSELAALLVSGDVALGMLPQPFVTTVGNQNDKVVVAVDLTAEWSKLTPDAALVTGCIVVRNDFLTNNKAAVDTFLLEYEESVNFANRDIADAAVLMDQYEIVAKAVAEKAIPECNIVYITGDDMQTAVNGFLQVLYDANPQAVGGKIPDDAFYYKG